MMDSVAWIALAAALTPASTLVVVGYSHLRAPARFRTELAAQGIQVLRARWFGVLVAAVELSVGCIAIAGVVLNDDILAATGLTASGALLCVFATFTAWQRRTHPGLPCACGGPPMAANGWTIVRALTLAGLATSTAFGPPGTEGFTATELLLAFAATGTLAILVWAFPASMALPGRSSFAGASA